MGRWHVVRVMKWVSDVVVIADTQEQAEAKAKVHHKCKRIGQHVKCYASPYPDCNGQLIYDDLEERRAEDRNGLVFVPGPINTHGGNRLGTGATR